MGKLHIIFICVLLLIIYFNTSFYEGNDNISELRQIVKDRSIHDDKRMEMIRALNIQDPAYAHTINGIGDSTSMILILQDTLRHK